MEDYLILQDGVKIPTGGTAREPRVASNARLIRFSHAEPTVTGWMEEDFAAKRHSGGK